MRLARIKLTERILMIEIIYQLGSSLINIWVPHVAFHRIRIRLIDECLGTV